MKAFIQHSKKLANWGLIQWVVIAMCIVLIIQFSDSYGEETDLLSDIVQWSATLAGVCVTGYMGNSSVEKYAERKFSLSSSMKNISEDEAEEVQG